MFSIFLNAGKPASAVPILFFGSILAAGFLGEVVARFYSEPMNRLLRGRSANVESVLGSVVENDSALTE